MSLQTETLRAREREREEGLSMMWPTVLDSDGITAEFTYFSVIFLSVFQVVFTEHVSLCLSKQICTISDRPIWASTTGTQEMFVDFFLFSIFFFFFK